MNLLTVDEVCHLDKSGNCIWKANDLKNMLHTEGVEFILKTLFVGSSEVEIPSSYYVGLDGRTTLSLGDTSASITGEPTTNGYSRYGLSYASGFSAISASGTWYAKSSTLLFNASGGSWGPVKNAFLMTTSDDEGYLISSVALPSTRTLNAGESFTFRTRLSIGV